jgi:hypothetical protein
MLHHQLHFFHHVTLKTKTLVIAMVPSTFGTVGREVKIEKLHKVSLLSTHQYCQEVFWPLKVQLDNIIGEVILPIFNP